MVNKIDTFNVFYEDLRKPNITSNIESVSRFGLTYVCVCLQIKKERDSKRDKLRETRSQTLNSSCSATLCAPGHLEEMSCK